MSKTKTSSAYDSYSQLAKKIIPLPILVWLLILKRGQDCKKCALRWTLSYARGVTRGWSPVRQEQKPDQGHGGKEERSADLRVQLWQSQAARLYGCHCPHDQRRSLEVVMMSPTFV